MLCLCRFLWQFPSNGKKMWFAWMSTHIYWYYIEANSRESPILLRCSMPEYGKKDNWAVSLSFRKNTIQLPFLIKVAFFNCKWMKRRNYIWMVSLFIILIYKEFSLWLVEMDQRSSNECFPFSLKFGRKKVICLL